MHMEMDASSRGGGMEDGGMAPFPATISVPLCLNLEQDIQDNQCLSAKVPIKIALLSAVSDIEN